MDHKFNLNISLFILCTTCLYIVSCEPLRGLTIRNWPYANQLENGQFEGLAIDILNEISRIAKITYTLKLSNHTEYGGWSQNGSVTGIIGQIYRNEADFAIGDITVLSTRDRYVHFSPPIMKFGLSALIRKDYVGDITSFKDLSEQTAIKYGVKKRGANLPLFHDSPVVSKMYAFMDANPDTFVSGEKEAIQRVKSQRYAFITESPFNEYVMNRDCDLTVVDDRRKNFQFEYAIAMRKDLLQRYAIGDALKHMKKSGKLDELKDKYFKSDTCREKTNVHEINPKSAQLAVENESPVDGRGGHEREEDVDHTKHHPHHRPNPHDPHGHHPNHWNKHHRHFRGSASAVQLSHSLVFVSLFYFVFNF